MPPVDVAIVTLLTDNTFLPGVQCLLYSLRDNDRFSLKIPKIVLVTSAVSKVTRKQITRIDPKNVSVVEVEAIPNPHAAVCPVPGWINSGFTKLRIYQLAHIAKKVVYIDADCVVVESVKHLCELGNNEEWNGFAAAPDVFPPDKFNAGVLVFRPSENIFSEMMTKIDVLPSHDHGDTGFLNSYYSDWFTMPSSSRLNFGYNAQRTLHWLTYSKAPGYWDSVKPLNIIHFSSSPKPWEDTKKKGDLEIIWWETYTKGAMGGSLNIF